MLDIRTIVIACMAAASLSGNIICASGRQPAHSTNSFSTYLYKILAFQSSFDENSVTKRRQATNSGYRFSSLVDAPNQMETSTSGGGLQDLTVFTQPWSCDCKPFWRDLGVEYFPRFVRDGRCRTNTCWFGHYRCVPERYDVHVLKSIEPRSVQTVGINTPNDDFTFDRVRVTTRCLCKR